MNFIPMTEETLKKRMLTTSLGSLVLVVVLIVVIASFARGQIKLKGLQKNSTQQTSTEDPNRVVTGLLGLSQKNGEKAVSRGVPVTFFLYADSKGQDITGYDAVLQYDTTKLEFKEVKSLIEGVDLYETNDEVSTASSDLVITGVKGLAYDGSLVFNNTALAEVTFTPLVSGETIISFMYEPGSSSDSNLIDSKSQDILSDVMGIQVTVR